MRAFNSNQKLTAHLSRKTGLKTVTKWADKENRPVLVSIVQQPQERKKEALFNSLLNLLRITANIAFLLTNIAAFQLIFNCGTRLSNQQLQHCMEIDLADSGESKKQK
jgi:hypothetical protein